MTPSAEIPFGLAGPVSGPPAAAVVWAKVSDEPCTHQRGRGPAHSADIRYDPTRAGLRPAPTTFKTGCSKVERWSPCPAEMSRSAGQAADPQGLGAVGERAVSLTLSRKVKNNPMERKLTPR